DMFNKKFDSQTLDAAGLIQYKKARLEFLCTFILQLDNKGRVTAGAYGGRWGAELGQSITDKGGKTKDNPPQDQPTWTFQLEQINPARKLKPGQAVGVALYKRQGQVVQSWVTNGIQVT